jgi:hypothetical protein
MSKPRLLRDPANLRDPQLRGLRQRSAVVVGFDEPSWLDDSHGVALRKADPEVVRPVTESVASDARVTMCSQRRCDEAR